MSLWSIKALAEAAEEASPASEEEQPEVLWVNDAPVPSEPEEPTESTTKPKKKRFETSKLIVWVCLLNGFLWVWTSYILAWFGRDQIAESLSQVAVTEIIGVVLVHCLKAAVENLSKNNNWPDKSSSESSDDSSAVG